MELTQILLYILIPCALAYIGYNERSKSKMDQRLRKAISRADLERTVQQAKEIQHIQHEDTKEDIKRLEKKIDRLLERK